MSRAKTLNFTVDSALLRELGERLVSTVHVAVSELVKNSYDADASEVRVEINESPLSPSPDIVVSDNGSGMTLEQVRDFWMRIGTTNKESQPVSPRYGRARTGSKGVGRFSCRRLGQKLHMITTAEVPKCEGKFQRTEVEFDWPGFTPGTAVEAVDVPANVEYIVGTEVATGTELRISAAPSNEWTSAGYKFLSRQLVLLSGNRGARRKGFEEDPGFLVHYKAPGDNDVVDIRDKLIDGSWGTLTGKVDANGEASFKLVANGLPGGRKFTPKVRFPGIEGVKLTLGIVPTAPKSRSDYRDPDLFRKYVASELTDKWGGVQVRYNGFRMYPYGEPADDWLEIEKDRARRHGKPENEELMNFAASLPGVNPNRVLLTMLSNRSYVGQVDVDSRMTSLQPKIDRQGFVKSEALDNLKKFTRMAIDWANIHRDDFIRRRDLESAAAAAAELDDILDEKSGSSRKSGTESISKATKFLATEVQRVSEYIPQGEREQTTSRLVQVTKAISAISRANESQIAHLRTMASASNLTLLFAHEVRNTLASLGSASARVALLAKKAPEVSKDLEDLGAQIKSSHNQLSDLVQLTGIVGTLSPDTALADLNLYDAVERTVQCFRLVRRNYSIDIDYHSIPRGLLVGPITDGELYTTLINITSNAIKSVIAKGGKKRIKFTASQHRDMSVLQVLDTGLGLSAEHFADAFTPFLSDLSGDLYNKLRKAANPQDREIFGSGSGLGLAISRDIVRSRNGEINFTNPPDGWAACVELRLP